MRYHVEPLNKYPTAAYAVVFEMVPEVFNVVIPLNTEFKPPLFVIVTVLVGLLILAMMNNCPVVGFDGKAIVTLAALLGFNNKTVVVAAAVMVPLVAVDVWIPCKQKRLATASVAMALIVVVLMFIRSTPLVSKESVFPEGAEKPVRLPANCIDGAPAEPAVAINGTAALIAVVEIFIRSVPFVSNESVFAVAAESPVFVLPVN